MLLGGKVGRLVYGGEAARFLPILRAGEILHVGKNAASGCGRLRVVLPEPPARQAEGWAKESQRTGGAPGHAPGEAR
jgi:CRISPR-associated endoribonuclease Cas6